MSKKRKNGNMAKRKDFPNNWQEYKDADDDMFHEHTFEEIMSWKVAGWELPSSVCCIIRTSDVETKKVKEYVYQKRSAAQAKVDQLIDLSLSSTTSTRNVVLLKLRSISWSIHLV